jgi:hypothetical protein
MSRSSKWPLPFWLSHQFSLRIPFCSHACYLSYQYHSLWLHHFNYTWRRVLKLLIKVYPSPYHYIPYRSRCSAQDPVLKHPQSTFYPKCQRPSFTPMQNHRQNYSSVYYNFILLDSRQEDDSSGLNVSKQYPIQFLLNFFLNQISICYCRSKIFELWTFQKDQLAIFMLWLCPTFWWGDSNIYLVFSLFTSRPTSLLASYKVCVLFFMVSMLSPDRLRRQLMFLMA